MDKQTIALIMIFVLTTTLIVQHKDEIIEKKEEEVQKLDNKLKDEMLKLENKRKAIQKLTLDIDNLKAQNRAISEDSKRAIQIYEDAIKELQGAVIELETEVKRLEDIKVFTMEATAYTDDVQSQGKWVGQTATGMKPQVGVVAVDPRIIPLGTKLYVEGYGRAIAGDTGGAIEGHRIDLFMASRGEALRFGRRQIRVRILD